MNARTLGSVIAVLAGCGVSDAVIDSESSDKSVAESVGKALTVGSSEYYPAPHASLSLGGVSSSPRAASFPYHPSGATTASDKQRVILLPGLPLNRQLRFAVDGQPDGATDPVITLVDGAFNVLGADDDSGPGNNSLLTFSVTATTGTPALLVREYGRRAGTFRLTVTDVTPGGGGGAVDEVLNASEGFTRGAMLGGLSLPAQRSVTYRNPPNLRAFTLSLRAGQTLTVQANSTGDALAMLFGPAPTYTLLIKDDDSGGNRNARFSYLVAQSGTYFLAFRDYHRADSTFDLRVEAGTPLPSVPAAPTAVSLEADPNGTLRLRYEVPFSSEFPLVQECRAEDRLDARLYSWRLDYNLDWSSSQRLVSKYLAGLQPGSHVFKVQCRNVAGWGAWSNLSNDLTVNPGGGSSSAPSAPTGVTIDGFEPGQGSFPPPSLVVSFLPGFSSSSSTTECEGFDTFTSRTVTWVTSYRPNSRASVRANDVTSGAHAFRVRCRNSSGWGPWSSDSATFLVGALRLPDAPSTPSVSAYSFEPGRVNLSFTMYDWTSAAITECRAQDVTTQNVTTLAVSSSSFYGVVRTSAGARSFRVACRNANGWGPWTSSSNTVTVY